MTRRKKGDANAPENEKATQATSSDDQSPRNGTPEPEAVADRDAVTAEEVAAEEAAAAGEAPAADRSAEDATVLSEEAAPARADAAPGQTGEPGQTRETVQTREPGQDAEQPALGADARGEDGPREADETDYAAETVARSGGGSGGLGAGLYGAIGAVIGGVVVLLGGQALQPGGPEPAQIATKLETAALVDERLETLAAELRGAAGDNQQALAALSIAFEELRGSATQEAQNSAAEREALAAGQASIEEAVASERTRLTRLNDELAQRERERVAAVTAIREQVSALAAAVAATPGADIGLDIGAGIGGEAAAAAEASAPSGAATAAASTRLALLEGGLRRVEARVNGLSAEALPTPDLTRIDAVEQKIAAVEAETSALSQRVEQAEQNARSAVKGEAATGVAFAALAQAVAGASPYRTPLDTLAKVADLDGIEPALTDHADEGLPSATSLASRFDSAARAALTAAAQDRAARGEGDFTDRLSGLFTIRRIEEGDATGDGEEAVLARAEARIDEGDVAAALAELEALPIAGRSAMEPWLSAAQTRAAAEAALERLRAKLLGVED